MTPYRPPPPAPPRRDLPAITYFLGTLACAHGVFAIWLISVHLALYGAASLCTATLLALAAERFSAPRARRTR